MPYLNDVPSVELTNYSYYNAFWVILFYVIQVEGPKSPEEMLVILQKVLEESSPVLVAARLDAEERRNNMRLREEQDAAYRAALEADQVCFL